MTACSVFLLLMKTTNTNETPSAETALMPLRIPLGSDAARRRLKPALWGEGGDGGMMAGPVSPIELTRERFRCYRKRLIVSNWF